MDDQIAYDQGEHGIIPKKEFLRTVDEALRKAIGEPACESRYDSPVVETILVGAGETA
jgi:hypothetical protein